VAATFEWDPGKDEQNRIQHGIAFREAVSAFMDPLSITIPDPDHSRGEQRFILVGRSHRNRLLVVVHTDREARIRMISAREADRRERRDYEKG
jgi:hypothetical protein